MIIEDMPKLQSPFVRKNIEGEFVVTPEIEEGYEWVFEDDSVLALEKLHGTNVSIVIEGGKITRVFNRTNEIDIWKDDVRIQAVRNAYNKGYCNFTDGQYFGEAIGPGIQGNSHNLKEPIWLPFESYVKKNLAYESWGKYPKTFEVISEWFKDTLISPLARQRSTGTEFVEGIVFVHPDGRMAKLRRDMFPWYKGRRHKE